MSNTASAKGNPACQHPKQLRNAENMVRSERNKRLMVEAGLTNRKQLHRFIRGGEVSMKKRIVCTLLAPALMLSIAPHAEAEPVVSPRAYCLNCYNERILVALDFIRRGL